MKATVTADTRYSFAPQFLHASTIFARKATEIEEKAVAEIDEATRAEHRGYVVAAIMQCAAALETEIHEVAVYGPGHQLGAGGTDAAARDFLSPCVDMIDGQKTLCRYEIVLHLLKRPALPRDKEQWGSANLLVRLRNELVHYKSEWGQDLERKNLFKALRAQKIAKPPFINENSNFFPHHCLSAARAKWAVKSAVAFLDTFYTHLGVQNPIQPYRSRLAV